MRNSIKNFWREIPRKYIYIGGVLLLIMIISIAWNGSNSAENRATVKTADIFEKVAITGKTKPQESVNLGFNTSGRIALSRFHVGDKVLKGQTIASLEVADLSADLKNAEASYEEENVKLAEIKSNSSLSASEPKEKTLQAVKQAYALADNAVRNQADKFFKTPRTNPSFEVKVQNGNFVHYFDVPQDTISNLNSQRKAVESLLVAWQNDITKLNLDNASTYASKSLTAMEKIGDLLDTLAFAVNSFTAADYDYESTVTGYKTSVDSARADLASARTSINTALQNLSSSPVSVGGVLSTISIQEAKVKRAEGAIISARSAISKALIVAPFDGVITKQDAKPGEVAGAGESLVSLISENQMYIEADVSEIKIGKVNIGDEAEVTFDAFPGEQFGAKVTFIDPGETLIDSVPNYKIRVELVTDNPNIKSGLTANVNIKTDSKIGVLSVPIYALTKEGNKYYAEKLVGGDKVKTEVEIGLVGFDSSVELLGGLSEGEEVVY